VRFEEIDIDRFDDVRDEPVVALGDGPIEPMGRRKKTDFDSCGGGALDGIQCRPQHGQQHFNIELPGFAPGPVAAFHGDAPQADRLSCNPDRVHEKQDSEYGIEQPIRRIKHHFAR